MPARAVRLFAVAAGALVLGFALPLYRWFDFVFGNDLYSYAILMPAACVFLVWQRWHTLAATIAANGRVAGILLGAVGLALLGAWCLAPSAAPSSEALQDQVTLSTAAFVALVLAAGLVLFGRSFFRAAAIPALVLICMIPLPVVAEHALESMLQHASAPTTEALFDLVGTPVRREGMLIHLSTIALKVAQECSGIHSTIVLFITSLFAGQLFLIRPWSRTLLILAVLPIAVLRNAVRIVVIGELCVHIGPEMIDSPIHHRGGPIFFALSLVPVFLLVFFLRRREIRTLAASRSVSP